MSPAFKARYQEALAAGALFWRLLADTIAKLLVNKSIPNLLLMITRNTKSGQTVHGFRSAFLRLGCGAPICPRDLRSCGRAHLQRQTKLRTGAVACLIGDVN